MRCAHVHTENLMCSPHLIDDSETNASIGGELLGIILQDDGNRASARSQAPGAAPMQLCMLSVVIRCTHLQV